MPRNNSFTQAPKSKYNPYLKEPGLFCWAAGRGVRVGVVGKRRDGRGVGEGLLKLFFLQLRASWGGFLGAGRQVPRLMCISCDPSVGPARITELRKH